MILNAVLVSSAKRYSRGKPFLAHRPLSISAGVVIMGIYDNTHERLSPDYFRTIAGIFKG